ncbi:MAG: DoxX family protein [Dermatophilaceae bacterium]
MSDVAPVRPPGRTAVAQNVAGVLRIAVGLLFILTGGMKLAIHAEEVELFERWGVPVPELAVTGTAVVEIVAGLALAAGVAMPLPAALLAGTMVGALVTAGRVDGGQHVVAPTVLLILLSVVTVARGGRWQLVHPLFQRGHQGSTSPTTR